MAGWPLSVCTIQLRTHGAGPSQGGLCKDTEIKVPHAQTGLLSTRERSRENRMQLPLTVLLLLIEMEGTHLFSVSP